VRVDTERTSPDSSTVSMETAEGTCGDGGARLVGLFRFYQTAPVVRLSV
jgi:hypothetical protein